MYQILIVDDEKLILKSLRMLFEKDFIVHTAETGAVGIEIAERENIDLVLLDLRLPDSDGIAVLKKIKQVSSETIVIMMTAYGTISNAVLAMKEGAFDYINKPFKAKNIEIIVRLALESKNLHERVEGYRSELQRLRGGGRIIGASKAMHTLFEIIEKAATAGDAPVLIEGESGTGKELIAQAIHYGSRRSNGMFMEVNCAAMPLTLLESELFGYEKGAFTDAKRASKGLIEQARGGTLFLDEIGDMDLGIQAKILKVIEEKKYRRLGGDGVIDADIRVIAATNHTLQDDVDNKQFRKDLFYRLNVIHISVPPLRERIEDIKPLALHFVDAFNKSMRKEVAGIETEALNLMEQYEWPGNVRELRNIIERIMIMDAPKSIGPGHLPPEIGNRKGLKGVIKEPGREFIVNIPDGEIDIKHVVASMQRELVMYALKQSGGRRTDAAKLLSISRYSLRYLIKTLNIPESSIDDIAN
ncbi:MAG: sigma-54 dependent transcriptional regulator [Syntrophales bacterium]|jgi:DNA-binding NtrC family response regulator|nr:sigma-54 dependent transcriptional regulator [Syntrophales bacterium]MDX9923089.1 sigma-54 dependent transcriptional regulator [Syntrophales bacterium]